MGLFGGSGGLLGGSLGSLVDLQASIIPGIGDSIAAADQNAANRKNANQANAFSERMANTSYQRAMDDMRKAGLNPMLAFSQGGASTPTPAVPTVNSESRSKFGEAAISTALGAKALSAQQQQADQAGSQIDSNIDVAKATTAKTVAETQNIQADTALKNKNVPLADLQKDVTEKGASVIKTIIDGMSNSAKNKSKQHEEDIKAMQEKKWDFKRNKVVPKDFKPTDSYKPFNYR